MPDVIQLHAGFGQYATSGRDGGGEHEQGIISTYVKPDKAGAWAQPQLVGHALAHDEQAGGTIAHLGGVACRRVPLDLRKAGGQLVVLKYRLELA